MDLKAFSVGKVSYIGLDGGDKDGKLTIKNACGNLEEGSDVEAVMEWVKSVYIGRATDVTVKGDYSSCRFEVEDLETVKNKVALMKVAEEEAVRSVIVKYWTNIAK